MLDDRLSDIPRRFPDIDLALIHAHEDYGANEAFDEYNTKLLRDADTLIRGRSGGTP
jgi:hypothetical protein